MRLHRHDEVVKAMARAMCRANLPKNGMFNKEQLEAMFDETWPHYSPLAAATLDAMLDAVVRLGVGHWGSTPVTDRYTLVLKTELKP